MCPCPECFPNGLPCHGTCRPDTVSCPLYRFTIFCNYWLHASFLSFVVVVVAVNDFSNVSHMACLATEPVFLIPSLVPFTGYHCWNCWVHAPLLIFVVFVNEFLIFTSRRCRLLFLFSNISQMFPKWAALSWDLSSWYRLLSPLQVIIVLVVEWVSWLLIVVVLATFVNDFSNVRPYLPRKISSWYCLLSPSQVFIVGIGEWRMEGDNLCVKGMRK